MIINDKDLIFTIGVAGGSGCGKTLIVNSILEQFPNKICYLKLDNYYKKHDELPLEQRKKINYDEPDAFDVELLSKHIKQLQKGQSINTPIYDFANHNRSNKSVKVEPKRMIIIEGTLALHFDELLKYMDTKIYVDVDDDIRILRRTKRDIQERGRTIDSVFSQYLATVKPMYEKYVAPSKMNADIIIPFGGTNKIAIDIIIGHINKLLSLEIKDKNSKINEGTHINLYK